MGRHIYSYRRPEAPTLQKDFDAGPMEFPSNRLAKRFQKEEEGRLSGIPPEGRRLGFIRFPHQGTSRVSHHTVLD